jgi:hypothetical protein
MTVPAAPADVSHLDKEDKQHRKALEDYAQKSQEHYRALRNAEFWTATVGFATGLIVCIATVCLFMALVHRGRGGIREQFIKQMVGEHGQQVQEWGGVAVLRNPVAVQELIRLLEAKG